MEQKNNSVTSAETKDDSSTIADVTTSSPNNAKPYVSGSTSLITYVLTISQKFPTTHSRKGEHTNFYQLILRGQKKHTIRGNYDLWQKRFEKIKQGKAVLSVRCWEDKPYNSKQIELLQFDNTKGIGLEKLEDPKNAIIAWVNGTKNDWETIANNDGLSFFDFCEWFKVKQEKPMAIIHFTDFRYCH